MTLKLTKGNLNIVSKFEIQTMDRLMRRHFADAFERYRLDGVDHKRLN